MAGIEVGSMTLKHTHPYSLEELHDLDTNHISEGKAWDLSNDATFA